MMSVTSPPGTGGADIRPGQDELLTRELIVAQVRDAADSLVLDLLSTGASARKFAAALAWLNDDEAALRDRAGPPAGRAGAVLDILRKAEELNAPGVTDEP